MLQTDWQEQTEKQMMEVDLTIYDAEYYNFTEHHVFGFGSVND